MCRSKTKRSLVEVSRGYILMHTSDLRRRPSCLYGDRFFGEAHLWTYGLRLFGAKRYRSMVFFSPIWTEFDYNWPALLGLVYHTTTCA